MKPKFAIIVLTVLLLSQQLSPCESLRVAAFNMQRFGIKKLESKPFLIQALPAFICSQHWDIAFLQEVTNQESLGQLIDLLNKNQLCYDQGLLYASKSSGGLPEGATYNLEIHAYIYRVNMIEILDDIVHQEKYTVAKRSQMQADVFFRPPAVMHVRANDLGCMPQFVLIGIHTRPHRTYSELNGLVDVYEWAKERYNIDNALILGDLNADNPYFGLIDKQQNTLWRWRDIFEWLVTDDMKTNVDEDRAYDRIIAAGDIMKQVAPLQNVRIPKWNPQAHLSNHYPVSVDLVCPQNLPSVVPNLPHPWQEA